MFWHLLHTHVLCRFFPSSLFSLVDISHFFFISPLFGTFLFFLFPFGWLPFMCWCDGLKMMAIVHQYRDPPKLSEAKQQLFFLNASKKKQNKTKPTIHLFQLYFWKKKKKRLDFSLSIPGALPSRSLFNEADGKLSLSRSLSRSETHTLSLSHPISLYKYLLHLFSLFFTIISLSLSLILSRSLSRIFSQYSSEQWTPRFDLSSVFVFFFPKETITFRYDSSIPFHFLVQKKKKKKLVFFFSGTLTNVHAYTHIILVKHRLNTRKRIAFSIFKK